MTRSALILGGSGGIGRAVVADLAAHDFRVAVWDRQTSPNGPETSACDVRNEAQLAELAARHFPAPAPLHALIYCVGHCQVLGAEEATPAAFRDHFEANVLGAALAVKHLLPALSIAHGQVVFLSSVSARVGFPGLSLYCASKAAVSGLARGLVPELAQRGVRINCILPTMVETPMMEAELAQRAARGEGSPADLRRLFEAAQPIASFAKPEEIARLVRLIVTGDLPLLTGAEICYDGGLLATR